MPLSQYSAASTVSPVASTFAQNVCDTLRIAGAMNAEDDLWTAIQILRRPNGEIYKHFAYSGEGWLNIAGRFHQTITAGLSIDDVPLGIHSFFQNTFFREFVASARFDHYFKTLADVLAEECYAANGVPEAQPSSKPESGTRDIAETPDSRAPTIPQPDDLIRERAEPASSRSPRRVLDTIPSPSAWHDEEDSAVERTSYEPFISNVMGILISAGLLTAEAAVAEAVDILNNETVSIYRHYRRPGISWAEIAADFHQRSTQDLAFESIPLSIHKFFNIFYFKAWSEKNKFKSYFAVIANTLDAYRREGGIDQEQISSRPPSGVRPCEDDHDEEEPPPTLRSPTVTMQNS